MTVAMALLYASYAPMTVAEFREKWLQIHYVLMVVSPLLHVLSAALLKSRFDQYDVVCTLGSSALVVVAAIVFLSVDAWDLVRGAVSLNNLAASIVAEGMDGGGGGSEETAIHPLHKLSWWQCQCCTLYWSCGRTTEASPCLPTPHSTDWRYLRSNRSLSKPRNSRALFWNMLACISASPSKVFLINEPGVAGPV